ncbi:MAG: glycosyltransferase [bacterium]
MDKVSVVIPVYNAERTIQKCIESVLDNDYDNFEITLVDDKSTDNTRKIIERFSDKRLKFFVNKIHTRASYSRNYGIKKSEGEIVLLLDSDSYVKKDWIRNHVRLHKEVHSDIIGGGIIGVHNTIYGRCDDFCSWWTSIPYSKDYYLTKLHLPTNNMSIKKNVFKKVGYFNEDLETGEDAEFCFRVLRNKLDIYFKSDLIVYHYDKDGLREFLEHQERWGRHAIKMRKGLNMEFSSLLPNSLLIAYIYILPSAIFCTAYIIIKWIKYKPSVLLYLPLIFLAKIKYMATIKDSFNRNTKKIKNKPKSTP